MRRLTGSITVFLSLVFLLVFALFGTLLETARYTVCKNHAARTLRTGAEGLLSEYNRPLYEHYGLFFIEKGGTPYEQVIGRYAGDTISAADKGEMDFLDGGIDDIQVKNKVYLGDNHAEALQKQIRSYMGRVVTKEQLQKVLHSSNDLKKVEKSAKNIETTVENQKKAAECYTDLLELMRLVDGITVTGGTIICEQEFVKMFVTGECKGQNFGVTEGAVWKQMKKNLDQSTKDWNIKNKLKFLAKVSKVKGRIKQAQKIGEKLKNGSASKDDTISRVIAALPVLKTNLDILTRTEEILQKDSVKNCKKRLEKLWQDYDTSSIVFDYTGVEEDGGGENPKDSLEGSFSKGILSLVVKSPSKLSKKSIQSPDSFAEYYKEQEKDKEDYEKRISDFISSDTVSLTGILGDMADYGMDEFCLDEYIQHKFLAYGEKTDAKWKQALDYGLEYLAAGKASDEENLESVLNRILLIRTVTNFVALESDSKRRGEARAAAIAAVGFTGLAPLITLTQTLILITWSISESLTDVAALLDGRDVPLWKTPKRFVTNFTEIVLMNHDSLQKRAKRFPKSKKSSFGYRQYLMLFLAMTKQSTRRYRVMDLIQNTMQKNGYKGFKLGSCVYEMKVCGGFLFPSHFFRMAPLESVLGRDVKNCRINVEICAGY